MLNRFIYSCIWMLLNRSKAKRTVVLSTADLLRFHVWIDRVRFVHLMNVSSKNFHQSVSSKRMLTEFDVSANFVSNFAIEYFTHWPIVWHVFYAFLIFVVFFFALENQHSSEKLSLIFEFTEIMLGRSIRFKS